MWESIFLKLANLRICYLKSVVNIYVLFLQGLQRLLSILQLLFWFPLLSLLSLASIPALASRYFKQTTHKIKILPPVQQEKPLKNLQSANWQTSKEPHVFISLWMEKQIIKNHLKKTKMYQHHV